MAEATRIVERKIDKKGDASWESMHTPESNGVRAEAQLPPDMPGIIIMVHGVNSEGEWYEDAEASLLAGLNTRLGREDLTPNKYAQGKPGLQHQIDVPGNSPIIHFYWGYRAKENEEKKYLIPLRDKMGMSAWIKEEDGQWKTPQYWGGGPFQNGTNNLQQLWSKSGFRRRVWAALIPVNVQNLNTEWDRQLQDAPSREYYAHAANRLAKLIDKIRNTHSKDTITLMSHSQGTMIAMAASLLCKTRAPDAVILMNSPYALEDKATDTMTAGNDRPTNRARTNTFINFIKRIDQGKRPLQGADLEELRVGATPEKKPWTPTISISGGKEPISERDNHGRVYVYFNPHDRVMGSAALQSIGWQGVSTSIVRSYGAILKQRMLARNAPCGDVPGEKPFGTLPDMKNPDPQTGKTKPFWDGNRKVLGVTDLWTTPDPAKTVLVNAEAVSQPLNATELAQFDGPKKGKLWSEDGDFKYFQAIYQCEKWIEENDPYGMSGSEKKYRMENQAEMISRIENYVPEPTDHSTLPKHRGFMQQIVAYDLPIGFCESAKDAKFWKELQREADWLSGADDYYNCGALNMPSIPDSIDRETVQDEMDNQMSGQRGYN